MHFIPQIVLMLSFRVCSSEITIRTQGGLFEQIISMLLFRIIAHLLII